MISSDIRGMRVCCWCTCTKTTDVMQFSSSLLSLSLNRRNCTRSSVYGKYAELVCVCVQSSNRMQFPCAFGPVRICRSALEDYVIYIFGTNVLLFLGVFLFFCASPRVYAVRRLWIRLQRLSGDGCRCIRHAREHLCITKSLNCISKWLTIFDGRYTIVSTLECTHICKSILMMVYMTCAVCAHVSTKWKYQWSLEHKMRNNSCEEGMRHCSLTFITILLFFIFNHHKLNSIYMYTYTCELKQSWTMQICKDTWCRADPQKGSFFCAREKWIWYFSQNGIVMGRQTVLT